MHSFRPLSFPQRVKKRIWSLHRGPFIPFISRRQRRISIIGIVYFRTGVEEEEEEEEKEEDNDILT